MSEVEPLTYSHTQHITNGQVSPEADVDDSTVLP